MNGETERGTATQETLGPMKKLQLYATYNVDEP